jgi:hypothetical protein
MLGMKLNVLKEIVQTLQRRQELVENLVVLRQTLEKDDRATWLSDVAHDEGQRKERIDAMEASACDIGDTFDNDTVATGLAMFRQFDGSSAIVKHLKHSATITRSETKHDARSGLLLGLVEAEIRATPQEIVAYMLDYDGRHLQSDPESDPASTVRREVLEAVNPFHIIIFNRRKAPGIRDRSFLNAVLAKKLAHSPLTYALVGVPIAKHDRITSKDEAGAVRAENCRSFRLTEVAPCRTNMEYVCSLDVKGFIPQFVTNMFAVPQQAIILHCAPEPNCTLFVYNGDCVTDAPAEDDAGVCECVCACVRVVCA